MKHSWMWILTGLLVAGATASHGLTVNTTDETVYSDAQSLSIEGASVDTGSTFKLKATMTFTLPTSDPSYSDVASTDDKLVIVADASGNLLIADGSDSSLKDSGVDVAEGDSVTVEATGSYTAADTLTFSVTLTNGTSTSTTSVTAPNTTTTLSTLAFEGEGTATNLLIAVAPQGILPSSTGSDGAQDSALVDKYVEWSTGTGASVVADSTTSDSDKSNAFAMNAGGTPSLTITDIDPTAGTITVVGSYTASDSTETTVDLGTINGTLYITYSDSLSGTATTAEATISVNDGEAATVTLPETAKFVKATVALTTPDATL